jgi:lipoprotein Spr
MKRRIAVYCVVVTAISLLISCSSSEELLHPTSYKKQACNNILDTSLFTKNESNDYVTADLRKAYKDEKYADYLKSRYSSLMQVMPEEIKSLMLYTFIDQWYGVRYRMGGRDENGIDCSGFAQKLYTDVFGIDLVRTSKEQFGSCRFVGEEEQLMEGDLVFFRIKGKRISHVGVYLMNSYFVHSAVNGGVMISSLKEEYWNRKFAGAGYIPKEQLSQ